MAGSALSAPRDMRFRWYRQVEQYGKTVPEVCDIFGISRKTYYKWYRKDHGLGSNHYKSRSIHPHTKLTPRVRVLLVEAKEQYNFGPEKMRLYLKTTADVDVSAKTIYYFMKRKGLIRKPQKKLAWYHPLREPYVARKPGENVQLDVKYIPSIYGTWLYQYRFVDTASDMQFATDAFCKDARATIMALRAAKQYFPFSIDGIQTDNGSEFRGVFHQHLLLRGITHRFIPKRSAPWNGKVERANRSVDDEYYLNPSRPWKHLWQYTRWYNHERPHLGKVLTGLTPYQKYLTITGKSVTLAG